jgi:pentapeptide MXKDX repeat protein
VAEFFELTSAIPKIAVNTLEHKMQLNPLKLAAAALLATGLGWASGAFAQPADSAMQHSDTMAHHDQMSHAVAKKDAMSHDAMSHESAMQHEPSQKDTTAH